MEVLFINNNGVHIETINTRFVNLIKSGAANSACYGVQKYDLIHKFLVVTALPEKARQNTA